MSVCVFAATGSRFDVDGYLRESSLKPFMVYRPGEAPRLGNITWRPQKEAGFLALVGKDEEPNVLTQALKALDFLSEHKAEFERLRGAGAEKMHLDFAVGKHQVSERAQYLPPELLLVMGQLQIGLVFSVIEVPKG